MPSSNPFTLLGVQPDDLRCRTDEEIKRLLVKEARRKISQYERGSKEREEILKIVRQSLKSNMIRTIYTKIMLKGVLDLSKDCLKNGVELKSCIMNVVDIYSERALCMILSSNNHCKKILYCFDENGVWTIIKNGECMEVNNRKIIGCVHFGTRPYGLLENIIKKRATYFEKSYFFDHFGHEHEKVTKWWVPDMAKCIPQSKFPFGIEHYIFKDIAEHSILLSLDNDGNIIPEGKVEGIYK